MAGLAAFRHWRERLSLRTAVALAVVAGLLIPAIVAAVVEMRSAEVDAREKLDRDAALIADVMSISMRNPVWQVAPELGRGTAQAMLRDPRVVGIMVRFDDGRPFLDIYRSVDALAANVSQRRSVVHEGREIGNVTVTLSSAPMHKELAERRSVLVWRFVGGTVVSLVLILWVLHRGLVDPLLQVTAAARRLADRQLDSPVGLRRGDELGDLASALDETRLALREAFAQLERRNHQLAAYADTLETASSSAPPICRRPTNS
jgi:signal transduction histidine kinase